ncbi:SDR family NAD(P)-dependent oxidoreductase [Lacisediminihabitans changchengi]|uniref:SDR family NAD(P)-dependent oxidoreductase n=1 Tax=Lacisediminihabitans changchengi TaxID=2787634 RepID=A0A934W4G2_9MICO|nr:SDR family NAD(P)-dependent oxidoreductase [Lacisediminihabitans changchengi]MBK4347460.1 SDR family NAD(P)-dependent oxidoreductase [Lacisediminihabitans changchengi]
MTRDLAGTIMVITGASSGVGQAAAVALASRGAEVAVVGRNPERTRAVAAQVGGTAFLADFTRLDEVRALADALLARYDRIDVLANNAGGFFSRRSTTVDGFDTAQQSNYLASFLLTRLLLDRLQASDARVITTSSNATLWAKLDLNDLQFANERWLGGWRAYANTKLENILFAKELGRRTGLQSYSYHPGEVRSGFSAGLPLMRFGEAVAGRFFFSTPEQGAEGLIFLAGSEHVDAANGTYFSRLTPNGRANKMADDPRVPRDLWERTERLLGLSSS